MSLARAPLISHFGAAIHGLTSIRAYGVEDKFKTGECLRCANNEQSSDFVQLNPESLKRIDKYSRVARPFWTLNRWFGLRIDTLGGIFSAALAG